MIALRLGAFLLLTLSFASGYAPHSAAVASFEDSRWRLKLNVGREKSTSLPADWGASGGRLLVGVDVDFTSELLPGAQDNTNGYTTVEIRRLAVVNGPSKFVSERGQKTVTFTDGGWCLRSQNDRSGAGPEAAHQLIGWVDCESGAARRDVTLQADSRLCFSSRVWTDEASVAALQSECDDMELKMAKIKADAGAWKTPNRRFFYWLIWKIDIDLVFAKLRNPVKWLKHVKAVQDWAKLKSRRDDIRASLPPPDGITWTSFASGPDGSRLSKIGCGQGRLAIKEEAGVLQKPKVLLNPRAMEVFTQTGSFPAPTIAIGKVSLELPAE